MFVNNICNISDVKAFQHKRLFNTLDEKCKSLYEHIDNYFSDYCSFYNISHEKALNIINYFSQKYISDVRNFINDGLYPVESSEKKFVISRIEYDVVLIASFLFEKHRFAIAKWISEQDYTDKTVLALGIGPGVELDIVRNYLKSDSKIKAFDLEVSDFVLDKHKSIVKQEHYIKDELRYDRILLIEILEHVLKPISLLNLASDSLKKNGECYLTTAINIPQFDHLYNFKKNEVCEMLKKCGLKTKSLYQINHENLIFKTNSINELVIACK